MDPRTVEELLTTTRAVRKRLDLDAPVPREVIEDCLRVAVQAPTGSNQQSWRWLVVTDATKRAALADLYRQGWEAYRQDAPEPREGDHRAVRREEIVNSSEYLARNLERVPVHVIPCILGRLDGLPNFAAASLYGSIFPAVWSFQLALRGRGLGSVLTTLHLMHESEAAALLGIPGTVTQVGLLPVAYTVGQDFRPAARRPAPEITYWDAWKGSQARS